MSASVEPQRASNGSGVAKAQPSSPATSQKAAGGESDRGERGGRGRGARKEG